MKDLYKKVSSGYRVNMLTGETFISQRKVAELCGVSQQAITKFWVSRKVDVKQGVTSENLGLIVAHYAEKGNTVAIKTLVLFAKTGAKAFIYHKAGVALAIRTNV